MPLSLKDAYPLRLIIGQEDLSFLLDNGGTWSNVDPGGYEAASFSVPRDLPQTLRGQNVRLDCGLSVAWEGRVSEVQRSLGAKTQIQCTGYGGLFADAEGSMVFVDRDLTRWQQPSYSEQARLLNANLQLGTSQVAADPTSNLPALVQTITDSWVSPYQPTCEAWYDAGPENLLAKIYYDLTLSSNVGGVANWQEAVGLSSDANHTTVEQSSNLNSASEVKGYFTPATPYRFAFVFHFYGGTPAGAQGAQYNSYWHNLAGYGNHGLTGRGSDPVGFYPSDIFGWALSQVPGLQPGVVALTDSSGYIVPHSVYYTPVTLDQIVGDMAKIAGWHWGVWESLSPLTGNALPRADFRPRPAPGAFTAFCERGACDTLDIREDLAQQYDQCVVSFSQVDGTQGAAIVTADNPILDQAGIPTRTLVLQGGTMTPATAAGFGAMALQLTNVQGRVSGSADVIYPIDGPSGPMAPWLLKSGIDRLRIGDLPCTDAWGAMNDLPISRVEASLSPSGINTSVELGSGADLVEMLQARLTAATTLAQQGGV